MTLRCRLGVTTLCLVSGLTGGCDGQPSLPSDHVPNARDGQQCSSLGVQTDDDRPEFGRGIAVDPEGQIFITGWTGTPVEDWPGEYERSFVLRRLASESDPGWTHEVTTDTPETGRGLMIDHGGDLVAVGTSVRGFEGQTEFGAMDGFVAKYSPDGDLVWATQLGSGRNDILRKVTIDADDNIYVVGYTSGELEPGAGAGRWDAFVARLSPDGEQQWLRQLGTPGSDHGSDVAVDAGGRVYITGTTNDSLGADTYAGWDAFVAVLDPDGTLRWIEQIGSAGDDRPFALRVSGDGDVFVAGGTSMLRSPGERYGDEDMFVVRLDPDGAIAWYRQLGTPGHDRAYALEMSADGLHVGGTTSSAFPEQLNHGRLDAVILEFTLDGDLLGATQFGTSAQDVVRAMARGPDGRFMAAGTTSGAMFGQSGTLEDLFVRAGCPGDD